MEDRHLLSLLWEHAENAIFEMSRRFGARLHATALNLTGSRMDAEECVNDTYMAVWDSIPPNKPVPLAPYILRIGRNIALNRLRANTAQKRGGYVLSLEELDGCIGANDHTDGYALGQAMDAYLSTISISSRILFVQRYWFGDSVKDIAKRNLMTENAVSVRLSRTREGLRQYLMKEGFL